MNSPELNGRQRPKQARSRVVVSRILRSAGELFAREGYGQVTTNRIAEAANVSIGSLYRYFRNREAVALAVYEEACSRAAVAMKRHVMEHVGLELSEAIQAHVRFLFELFEEDSYALFRLLDEVPELRLHVQPVSFERQVHQVHVAFLRQHAPDADEETIARKSYFIEKMLCSAIARYLEEVPEYVSKDEALSELVLISQGYIETLPGQQAIA